jgi:hypothetical protein
MNVISSYTIYVWVPWGDEISSYSSEWRVDWKGLNRKNVIQNGKNINGKSI